jgi:phenylpropionate dioxygenase-like ring-hydroxylating dioxygenase large terminal subunit
LSFEDYWYIIAESHELSSDRVLPRTVLGEWLAVFRDADGHARAIRDRCMHRAGRLSRGTACKGHLQCPYHGWTYDGAGEVVAVPAEGDQFVRSASRKAQTYATFEDNGYIWVCLSERPVGAPYQVPAWSDPAYRRVRLQNRFQNTVTNCVENFIDVPHTVSVHPGIFRTARRQTVDASVSRRNGVVHVDYRGETDNLGWFSWFLNPDGNPIEHTDTFICPNVTTVSYRFGPRRHFVITSQSVPVGEAETLVYTDLTFDYGPWNLFAGPIVAWQGQKVIDQDLVALAHQREVIARYGERFANTPCDIIHVWVESIRDAIARGEDPTALAEKSQEIRFYV